MLECSKKDSKMVLENFKHQYFITKVNSHKIKWVEMVVWQLFNLKLNILEVFLRINFVKINKNQWLDIQMEMCILEPLFKWNLTEGEYFIPHKDKQFKDNFRMDSLNTNKIEDIIFANHNMIICISYCIIYY